MCNGEALHFEGLKAEVEDAREDVLENGRSRCAGDAKDYVNIFHLGTKRKMCHAFL